MQYYYTLLVAGPDQILDRFKGASSVWNFGGHRKKVPFSCFDGNNSCHSSSFCAKKLLAFLTLEIDSTEFLQK